MLLNTIKSMDVITLKLSSGEEIIGLFVEKNDKSIKVRKPLLVSLTQNGPALIPYLMSVNIMEDVSEIEFNKDLVVTMSKTYKPFSDAYLENTTGLKLHTFKI
jgi:hypothetical protein